MDVTGTLKVKNPEMQVSDKFKKREFVLTDNSSQYPQHISFQLTQDKCSILDNYNVGDTLKVHFNLRGREWTDREGKVKYFNSLEAWRIENVSAGNNTNSEERTIIPEANLTPMADDLPF